MRVPDLALFPRFFGARSVVFRAGLELGVMNAGLVALSFLRSRGLLRAGPTLIAIARALALALAPFGSDRGGMVVRATGRRGGKMVTRSWQLVAERGEGPLIPAIPVRALLRDAATIAPGARPCLAEVSLTALEDAMADLAVTTGRREEPSLSLFEAALGEAWHDLPRSIQRLHATRDLESFSGRATVERGTSSLARFAAWFFGFPRAGADVPLTITKLRTDSGEIWERDFDGRVFRSYLTPCGPGRYRERFGPFNYEQELPVADGALHFPVRRGWFLGIPLPRFLLPRSECREFETDGEFRFDVGLYAPLGGGLIVRYRGTVAADVPQEVAADA